MLVTDSQTTITFCSRLQSTRRQLQEISRLYLISQRTCGTKYGAWNFIWATTV